MPVYRIMHLFKDKNGNFRYRRGVPAPLHPYIGKTEIKRSLKTKDRGEAERKAEILDRETEAEFEIARRALAGAVIPVTSEQLREIHEKLEKTEVFAKRLAALYTPELAREDAAKDTADKIAFSLISLDMGDTGKHDLVIDDVLSQYRLSNIPDNRQQVFQVISEVTLKALGQQLKVLRGESITPQTTSHWAPTPAHVHPVASVEPTDQSPPISEMSERYIRESGMAEQTANETRRMIGWFIELKGDRRIRSITRNDILDFRDSIAKRPGRDAGKQVSSVTVQKYLNLLSSMFKVATEASELERNPVQGLRKLKANRTPKKRQPFTTEELTTIFNGDWYQPHTEQNARFWVPLLSLFTGARLNELAQLRVSDITEEAGIWCLSVVRDDAAEEEDDTEGHVVGATFVKNDGSTIRTVPLHQELIRIGFIDYVLKVRQSGSIQLFPELTPDKFGKLGKTLGGQFAKYKKALGFESQTKVFHSFRHGFKQRCRSAQTPEDTHDYITGHTSQAVGRSYGFEADISALKEFVDRIEYPGLDLGHLYRQ
ncbi:site-specific integrase [Nisaea sp.]|uniref:site-specific integrase n=1 Tax=Nisaea sp. TaxID=2024842 RepID=UPI00326622D2